jgi:hypothetical protein
LIGEEGSGNNSGLPVQSESSLDDVYVNASYIDVNKKIIS